MYTKNQYRGAWYTKLIEHTEHMMDTSETGFVSAKLVAIRKHIVEEKEI